MTPSPFRWLSLLGLLSLPVVAAGLDPSAARPPVARKVPHKVELHGDIRIDDYFWMKDKNNPEVLEHLKAENAYTAAVMKPTEKLQDTLYKEYLGRLEQTDLSVPYQEGEYSYYSRTREGQQYPIYCRKKAVLDAPEEVILDVNDLARGQKFLSARPAGISDDGNLLAYVSDNTGFREYYTSVKDLRTGKVLEDRFVKAATVTWAADNKTLFYVTEDAAKRPHKLWRHMVGQPKEKDVLVYEEKDELYRLMVSRSRDRKYVFHTSFSSTTTEEWFLPADEPGAEFRQIAARQDGHQYHADHRAGLFYLRTNRDGATNFKVMTCPAGDTDPRNWKDFLAYNPAVMVSGVTLFKNQAVITEREAGVPHLRVFEFRDGKHHRIVFPEPIYSVGLGTNPEFDSDSMQMTYTSLVTPQSVYRYVFRSGEWVLLKRQKIPAGYDPNQYVSEWIFATASDGTMVPISLVYKKGLKKDGSAGCLLYGYGSYGSNVPVAFNATRLSLLDRGLVFAQAQIRGGSEMGRPWYLDGKMLKKKNTFTDFIACADHLVREKYCARNRLAIQGGSAGGLLIAATLNLRPDLCKAAVLQVPFVDVINSMLDESMPLTVQEFLEWGNPKKQSEYEYMKTYCPYSNLAKKAYPSMLVTTSLNDSQVLFHEPTKYVAKLRTLRTDANPLLFRCNMAGGHGGASGRYDALKEQAFMMAFVLTEMGCAE
jgi:oligopeptidase B